MTSRREYRTEVRACGAGLVGLALAWGCAGGAPEPVAPQPVAPQPAIATTCDDLLAQYRAGLAAASGTCRTDADCGKYGGLDPDDVCGGSTDAETARALERIGDQSDAAGCGRPGYSCPAIEVRCVDQTCR